MASQLKLFNFRRWTDRLVKPTLGLVLSLFLIALSWQSVLAGSLPAPMQTAPANDAVLAKSSSYTLSWQAVSGAISYRLQVSADSTFSTTSSIAVDSVTTSNMAVVSNVKPLVYYWRVQAADSTDTSSWSSVWSYDAGPPPSPSLLAPPNGASDRPSPITLRWSAPYADSSRVQLANYKGDYSFSPGDIVLDTTVSADSVGVSGLGLGQTYYWRVLGKNVNQSGPWSTTGVFYTSYPPSVSLLQPGYAAQVSSADINCSWLQSGGVVAYELQVSTDQFYNSPPVLDTIVQATSFRIDSLPKGGTYYWRVRGKSNVGGFLGTWSSAVFYTFPAAPSLLIPANGGSTFAVNPTLRWRGVNGAAFYRIQLALDSTFASIVLDSTTTSAVDSLTLDSLNAGAKLYWHVEGGSNNNGWGPYSATFEFSTGPMPPNPPLLLAPGDSSTLFPLDVVVSWSRASGAERYLVELSSDSTFRNLVVLDSSVAVDSLRIDSLKTGAVYFWRVKSESSSSGWGLFSEVRRFFTESSYLPSPLLEQPADSTVNLPTSLVLRWSAVTHAALYQVQLSSDSVMDTLTVNDSTLAVDSVSVGQLMRGFRYYWRVRAGVAGGGWGPFSNTHRFTIEPWTQGSTLLISTILNYPHYSNIAQFKPTDYRLFGIPGNSGMSIAGLLKGTPGRDWQAFTDNGDSTNFLLKYDASGNFNLVTGKAFWLIYNGQMKIDTSVYSSVLDSIGQIGIELHHGWNIITDPFSVDVPWDSVQSINGVNTGPIWGYNNGFNTSSTLAQFQGYYYFNPDSAKVLKIPYMEVQSRPGHVVGTVRTFSVNSTWTLRLTLSTGGLVDSSAWFGVSALATNGFNTLDARKPEGPGLEPSVYFDHPEWDPGNREFASEMRPAFGDSSEWTLAVNGIPGTEATLSFNGLQELPETFSAYLYNPTTGSWTDMRSTPVFTFVPESRTSTFTILVGRSDLVSGLLSVSEPNEFRLDRNYPNPFNPTTVIGYHLPAQMKVSMTVYNVIGQRVTTLVDGVEGPGEHSVQFDGSRFASGVYFYRLIAGGRVFTGKMALVK